VSRILIALLFAAALEAQPVQLRVLSEFQRVDPFGNILPQDRAARPREILSPAVARNGHASFHVAVTAPANESYFLVVQANPDNQLEWKIYEERFIQQGDAWIPDGLEEAREPYFGVIPDPSAKIPGQTTRVYLVDVWVPREARVGLVRLEVLVKVGYWRIWPMEVRVRRATVPDMQSSEEPGSLPAPSDPADAAARAPLDAFLAGKPMGSYGKPANVRAVIRRNAVQDMALAGALGGEETAKDVQAVPKPPQSGAEWYLRVRDYLYRAAGN
jgi:hypothetical protein